MPRMPLVRVHDANQVQLDQVDRPGAGADDVVVRVAYCGICGSDIHRPGQVKVLVDCRE